MNVACTILHYDDALLCILVYTEGADVCRSVYRIQIASNFSKILAYTHTMLLMCIPIRQVCTYAKVMAVILTAKCWNSFAQQNILHLISKMW